MDGEIVSPCREVVLKGGLWQMDDWDVDEVVIMPALYVEPSPFHVNLTRRHPKTLPSLGSYGLAFGYLKSRLGFADLTMHGVVAVEVKDGV